MVMDETQDGETFRQITRHRGQGGIQHARFALMHDIFDIVCELCA
jgi:hypothetical protein